MTNERIVYLKKIKRIKLLILFIQILLFLIFIISWELLSKYKIINSFIFSSPSKIIITLVNLIKNNNLLPHILTTLNEIILSFLISYIFSFILALIFYNYNIIKKIIDPFLILINSLPKIALGPLIIIWFGANINSIIVNSLLISTIVTITTLLDGFNNINQDNIKLFKILKSSKYNILTKLIIPSSKKEIISAIKLNISLTFIGVIMGEFLTCKKGIGYLILYGTQIFDLSLVMTGIFILLILSFIFYLIINYFDKKS